jgi:hypothetical protein
MFFLLLWSSTILSWQSIRDGASGRPWGLSGRVERKKTRKFSRTFFFEPTTDQKKKKKKRRGRMLSPLKEIMSSGSDLGE